MYTTPTTNYYARASDEDGSDLSRQNIIIIAVCSSFGGLFLAYFLYRNIRNCVQRADSTPHPLPQPLSHHRQQQMEQQFPRATLYDPQFAAGDPLRLEGSKVSLLGTDSPGLASSIPPSIDTPSDSSHQHLPIPTAPYLHNRPSTSFSLASSDASSPPPIAVAPLDSATATPPRPSSTVGSYSPARTPPVRRARPLSMSSTNTYGSVARSSRIYGAPHAPHNQIQIILPTPLSSATASKDSLAVPRGQYGTDAFDRKSIADPWITMPGHMNLGHRSTESLSLPDTPGREPRRRHASIAAANPRAHSALYESESPPPMPALSTVSESYNAPPVERNKSRRLEKRRESQHRGRINAD